MEWVDTRIGYFRAKDWHRYDLLFVALKTKKKKTKTTYTRKIFYN